MIICRQQVEPRLAFSSRNATFQQREDSGRYEYGNVVDAQIDDVRQHLIRKSHVYNGFASTFDYTLMLGIYYY